MPERLRRLAQLVVPAVAIAVIVVGLWPSDAPADPEARAHALATSLKCPICAGESIAASQTDLAGDLRELIGDEIAAGSDSISVSFVSTRASVIGTSSPPKAGCPVSIS